MGKPSYVCTVCSETFTRKYSARRHNQNLHNGAAEIVRLIDYLAGRSSGQYTPNNPFWFKRNNPYHYIAYATVADRVGDSFQLGDDPQLAPLDVFPYSSRPLPTMEHQNYAPDLSLETTHKINELKRLVYKYPQFHNIDPDKIVRWAVHGAITGDNRFLNAKLKQLVSLDFYKV